VTEKYPAEMKKETDDDYSEPSPTLKNIAISAVQLLPADPISSA